MIILTRPAIAALENILQREGKIASGVRISATNGGCSGPNYEMAIESDSGPDDTVIEIREVRLFAAAENTRMLVGSLSITLRAATVRASSSKTQRRLRGIRRRPPDAVAEKPAPRRLPNDRITRADWAPSTNNARRDAGLARGIIAKREKQHLA